MAWAENRCQCVATMQWLLQKTCLNAPLMESDIPPFPHVLQGCIPVRSSQLRIRTAVRPCHWNNRVAICCTKTRYDLVLPHSFKLSNFCVISPNMSKWGLTQKCLPFLVLRRTLQLWGSQNKCCHCHFYHSSLSCLLMQLPKAAAQPTQVALLLNYLAQGVWPTRATSSKVKLVHNIIYNMKRTTHVIRNEEQVCYMHLVSSCCITSCFDIQAVWVLRQSFHKLKLNW